VILFGSNKVLAEGSSAYNNFTATYWSGQQAAVNPSCVFKPSKTLDVSTVILLARLYQCPFAVKGGGHAAFAGSSSVEDGITISLENFKQAIISADRSTVDVGPGLHWVDAYIAVEEHGLGIVGGRVSSKYESLESLLTWRKMAPVGVSGLTLGGGISHFASRRGWACDNVESFELVTASGLAIDVTAKSYPDLYWALRGGGGNFGIVTNFKLRAFPLGQMWGGQRMYSEDSFPEVLDAIYNFAVTESSKDLDAAEFVVSNFAVPDFFQEEKKS
jgi:FAD/FMN-containing dehydrogenase